MRSTSCSSALRADERARVVPNIGFSARSAVEPSLERHRFAATSSSRTRVPAAHHDSRNAYVPRPGGGSAPCGMTLNSRPLELTASDDGSHVSEMRQAQRACCLALVERARPPAESSRSDRNRKGLSVRSLPSLWAHLHRHFTEDLWFGPASSVLGPLPRPVCNHSSLRPLPVEVRALTSMRMSSNPQFDPTRSGGLRPPTRAGQPQR